MSSVQSLREFISERLTAAAEEIFTEFERNIVRYEEEIDRQRRLLDISWKPQRNTTELPQHCVWKEKVLTDQHLYNQERNSSLDQEEPEPPQIEDEQEEPEPPQMKGKQEEICTSQDEEQLSLKQEYDTVMVTPAYEEINYKKPEPAQEEPEPAQEEPEPAQEEPERPQQEQLCLLLYLPQHHTWKEKEVLTDQWLCSQERNSSLDQEELELPQIKEEHEDLEIPQIKEEQKDPDPPQGNPKTLEMKEEQQTETFMVTPVYKERNHGKVEPNRDQQFSLNSSEAENQVQEGSRETDSGFHRDKELKQNKRSLQTRGHGDNVDHPKLKKNPKKCFMCLTCGRKFCEKYYLTTHMRTHTGERPFLCQTCGKHFFLKETLKVHMKIHTGERPFSCLTCGKSFTRKDTLNVHMKTHTGEKPFSCQICGKSYHENNSFKYHMKTHTGERPFSCQTCGKSFICRSTLNTHMKTHTGERPFVCPTCGKRFVYQRVLDAHMRTHTVVRPFSCQTCGKSFIRRSTLNDHMKTHTDKKTFLCHTCGKSFVYPSILDAHMRTHTGARPFPCQTCGKSFIHKFNLNCHMKTHSDFKV